MGDIVRSDGIKEHLFVKFSSELLEIGQQVDTCVHTLSNPKLFIDKGLKTAVTLSQSWAKENVLGRRRLQVMVFPDGVYYDRKIEGYRTSRLNGIFALSSEISCLLAQKEKGKSNLNDHFSLLVVRRATKPITLAR